MNLCELARKHVNICHCSTYVNTFGTNVNCFHAISFAIPNEALHYAHFLSESYFVLAGLYEFMIGCFLSIWNK